MIYPRVTNINNKIFIRIAATCFLILTIGAVSFAQQYKGAPVKKDRLIEALRSRQLQTRDIVTIIKSNGVNFALTPKIKEYLIDAGARPEVIKAIDENLRLPSNNDQIASKNGRLTSADYDDLLDQAIYIYKQKNNPQGAIQFLKTATTIKPNDPAAYQMLGFINLYGLKNLWQAKAYMQESISKGGSAVFRVFHDDNGDFTRRCTGSLYISPDSIRYESDDNIHTFETSTLSVSKIKLDRQSSRAWKKRTIFKIFLKIGGAKTKFRFSPLSGKEQETKMVEQLVLVAKIS